MPSKPYTRSLNRLRKHPKPLTPSQRAFVQQKGKNQRQAGHASRGLLNMDQSNVENEPEWINIPMNDHTEDNDILGNLDTQADHFSEDTDILNHLNRARYDTRRLERESRWAEQCQLMLPTFLRCQAMTADWGDKLKWSTDHQSTCSCNMTRKRKGCVDMVDILCDSESLSLNQKMQPETKY